jgi:hypothetical protein
MSGYYLMKTQAGIESEREGMIAEAHYVDGDANTRHA